MTWFTMCYYKDLIRFNLHSGAWRGRKQPEISLSFAISLLALHHLREDWLEKPYGRWQTKGRHCVHTVPRLRHPATPFKGLIGFGWVFWGMYVFHGYVCLPQVLLILKQFVGVNSSSEHSAAAVTVTPAGTGYSLRRGWKILIFLTVIGESATQQWLATVMLFQRLSWPVVLEVI